LSASIFVCVSAFCFARETICNAFPKLSNQKYITSKSFSKESGVDRGEYERIITSSLHKKRYTVRGGLNT